MLTCFCCTPSRASFEHVRSAIEYKLNGFLRVIQFFNLWGACDNAFIVQRGKFTLLCSLWLLYSVQFCFSELAGIVALEIVILWFRLRESLACQFCICMQTCHNLYEGKNRQTSEKNSWCSLDEKFQATQLLPKNILKTSRKTRPQTEYKSWMLYYQHSDMMLHQKLWNFSGEALKT